LRWIVPVLALLLCGMIVLHLYVRSSDGWGFSQLCAHEAGLLRKREASSGYADPLTSLRRDAEEGRDRQNQLCIAWRNEAIVEVLVVLFLATGVLIVGESRKWVM
jgi:hypothetical protein